MMKPIVAVALVIGIFGLGAIVAPMQVSAQDQSTKDAIPPSEFAIPMKNVFAALQNPRIAKDLELQEDQSNEIKELANSYRMAIEDAVNATRKLPTGDPAKIDELLKEHRDAEAKARERVNETFTEKLNEVLVSSQQIRLRQITVQLMLARPNFFSTYQAEALAKRAELSKKQADRLQEIAKQVEAEFLKELRELKLKHHEEVRESLGMDVLDRIQQILGDPYIASTPPKR